MVGADKGRPFPFQDMEIWHKARAIESHMRQFGELEGAIRSRGHMTGADEARLEEIARGANDAARKAIEEGFPVVNAGISDVGLRIGLLREQVRYTP